MSIPKHIQEHAALGIYGTPNNVVTVGSNGRFSTISDAINYIATLPAMGAQEENGVFSTLGTVSVAANSSKIVGSSTFFSYFASSGMFVEFDSSGTYYQVKRLSTDTSIYMFGGIAAGVASTSDFKFYSPIPYTIQLLPGEHTYTTAADLDFSALNGYHVTLAGSGINSTVLNMQAGTGYDITMPGNGFFTLSDFTLKRNRNAGGRLTGGAGGVLSLNNFCTNQGGSSENVFSTGGLRGLLINGYYSDASPRSVSHALHVQGFAAINNVHLRGAGTDEELQLSVTSDVGFDQPWLIHNVHILRQDDAGTNYARGPLRCLQSGEGNQDKKVIISHCSVTIDAAITNGNLMHFDNEGGKTGTGRMKSWVSHCSLNDLQGNTGPVGIYADGDHDVVQSNNYINVGTATGVANGATIT